MEKIYEKFEDQGVGSYVFYTCTGMDGIYHDKMRNIQVDGPTLKRAFESGKLLIKVVNEMDYKIEACVKPVLIRDNSEGVIHSEKPNSLVAIYGFWDILSLENRLEARYSEEYNS